MDVEIQFFDDSFPSDNEIHFFDDSFPSTMKWM